MARTASDRWHATVRVETAVSIAPETGRHALMDLALDPDMHAASQAGAREQVLARTGEGLLALGDVVTFRARHFGLPWTMTAGITELERPSRFVDEQVDGPFAAFRHTHRFEARDVDTVMVDEFAFRLPGGALGHLVARVVAAPYLRRLLTHRAALLAEAAQRTT